MSCTAVYTLLVLLSRDSLRLSALSSVFLVKDLDMMLPREGAVWCCIWIRLRVSVLYGTGFFVSITTEATDTQHSCGLFLLRL